VAGAYERSEASTLLAVVAGTAAVVGTVIGVVWYRRRVDQLGDTARRALGWFGIAWSVLFVVAFLGTHAGGRDDNDAGPLQAGVVTYLLLIIVAAVALFPILVVRHGRPKPHEPHDLVRVWQVDGKAPFFIAYCDCGWVGAPHEADEPHARDHAFRDARGHGTNVAPEVEDPLA